MLHYHTFILFQIESSTFFDHVKYNIYDTIIHLQDRQGKHERCRYFIKKRSLFPGISLNQNVT